MILPYTPAGLPAVGILGQSEQLLGRVEVYLWSISGINFLPAATFAIRVSRYFANHPQSMTACVTPLASTTIWTA